MSDMRSSTGIQSEFFDAAKNGQTQQLAGLVSRGADVNVGDRRLGKTALMYAAESGHVATVTELVHLGADVNRSDVAGQTALMRAAFYGRTETAIELVLLGADVNAVSDKGVRVLDPEYIRGNQDMVTAITTTMIAIEGRRERVVAAVAEVLPIPFAPEIVAAYVCGEVDAFGPARGPRHR